MPSPKTEAPGASLLDAVAHVVSMARSGRRDLAPQERAAFAALDKDLTAAQRAEFTRLWREAPAPSPGPTGTAADAITAITPFIRRLESCELKAYPDPETGGEPWTIGWGSTTYLDGASVLPGDTITQEQADKMLAVRLDLLHGTLARTLPGWEQLSVLQKAAMLSFSDNNGAGWFSGGNHRTLAGIFKARNWRAVPGALMMYRNPGGPTEVGLGRRRRAEGLMWLGTEPAAAFQRAATEINTASDCRAWEQTLKATPPAPPVPPGGGLRPPAPPVPPVPSVPAIPAAPGLPAGPVALPARPNPLPVPYFPQLDAADRRQAERMCFSSSCAMLLEFLRPGTLPGAGGDDVYLQRVARFGDTTTADAQVKALASYGVKARLKQDCTFGDVRRQLDKGIPVPFGWIHRGSISNPTGFGHWAVMIGYQDAPGQPGQIVRVYVHDPFGDMDLLTGQRVGNNGRALLMTTKNLGKRWMLRQQGGRWVYAPGNGWAIFAER